MSQVNQEIHLKVLRYLEHEPEITQRELAKELGVSLGKANYCLKALIDKGLVKAGNFKKSDNKRAYLYLLTAKGIDEKSRITLHFLKRKIDEYELLRREINELQREVQANDSNEIQVQEIKPIIKLNEALKINSYLEK